MFSRISIKQARFKSETFIRRRVWRGTGCFALRSNYLRKNLYKADISIKWTLFLHQWCLLYRDSTVVPSNPYVCPSPRIKISLFLFIYFSFCIWVFFHIYSRFTGQQGKGEGIYLTPHYHVHPFHRHLDINRAITAESWPGFRTHVANH